MATKLEQFEQLQPLIQKEIKTQFEALYKEYATKYGVASVPLHRHNGADSPFLGPESITSYLPLPATPGGVASPTVLNGQVINDTTQASNPALAGTKDSPTIFVDPLPIIYSSGSETFNGGDAPIGTMVVHTNPTEAGTLLWIRVNPAPGFTGGNFTFTSSVSNGATSATLTSDWDWPTGIYWITFSDSEQLPAAFTNGSTSVTWDSPKSGAASSSIRISGLSWVGVSMNALIIE